MKTKIFLIIITILICNSCSDFLEEDPRGIQMAETFYNTEKEAYAGLIGIYGRVRTNALASNNTSIPPLKARISIISCLRFWARPN